MWLGPRPSDSSSSFARVSASSGVDAQRKTRPSESLIAVLRPPMLSGPRLKGIEKMVMCWSSVRITSSEAMAGDDREASRVASRACGSASDVDSLSRLV